MKNNNWTRNELIVAFNLYCKTPFTKINANNKAVKELAPIIGRSVGSLAMKLANFARLDPDLKARGVRGLKGGSKGEVEIWNEFNDNWAELAYESEKILAQYKNTPIEKTTNIDIANLPPEGREREAIIKSRVNQSFFRDAVIASYNYKCCITGISAPELLIAGHIIPWAINPDHRTNPANGLCLNALHDKAFDKGLMTITPDYKIKFSDRLLTSIKHIETDTFFFPYNGKLITRPQKFYPLREFLEYHNQRIFLT